jgi:hypothetical protein
MDVTQDKRDKLFCDHCNKSHQETCLKASRSSMLAHRFIVANYFLVLFATSN